jgi:hypothetical protein
MRMSASFWRIAQARRCSLSNPSKLSSRASMTGRGPCAHQPFRFRASAGNKARDGAPNGCMVWSFVLQLANGLCGSNTRP